MERNHPKTDLYMADRDAGLTYAEIAAKHGISKQRVAQVCAKRTNNYFKPYTAERVVYPHLRKWLNDNKITRREFIKRMGYAYSAGIDSRLSVWFRGKSYPQKPTIDKIIAVTGLTYEQLFAREGENG